MDITSTQQHGARGAIVRIAAVVVAVAMLIATAIFGVGRAQAAELTASADPTTFTQWTEGVGNPVDPRSTGRVWTDKSVTTGDVTLDAGDGKQVVIAKDEASDFLVGLSAMSSAQQITGMSSGNKPLDVTLVLDVSGSMSSSMGWGYRPAYGDDLDYTAYVKTDDGSYKAVSYDYTLSVDGNVAYKDGDTVIYAKTSAEDANPDHVQLYNSYRITRLAALKTAVNGFLG